MSGEQVTITIDGRTVQVRKGTTILEATRTMGISIPYYCYHPGLSVAGSCRMCLVEIEKNPKLQPSCATPAMEGMVVRTQTPAALQNRRGVLEFLLLNHPLDCPVCDQAGECELQNYYMDHGRYDPRFNENKMKRKKAFPIGPYVILDQERCILCTRCVRFCNEISGTGELCVHNRGHFSEIDIFPGAELNNPYSGNVVDICPVGALTDRDFRFECRVWFLGRTRSICPGCSRGCNIEIHFNEQFNPRYHHKRVHRLKPRFNPDVNSYWMCDEGRYAYHSIDARNRLAEPAVRDGNSLRPATWDEAIEKAATALQQALKNHGAQGVGLLASPQMTNEELFHLKLLFRDMLKVENIEYRVPLKEAVYSDDFLITADKHPNSRSAEVQGLAGRGSDALLRACAEGQIRFLYICHHDLTRGYDVAQLREALGKVDFIAFQGPWRHWTCDMSHAALPAAVCAEKEGSFTNIQGRVQRIHAAVPALGDSLPDLEIIGRLGSALDAPLPLPSPAEVFRALAERIPAFAGMSYETVGDGGQLLKQD